MFGIGMPELVIVLLVAFLLFGPQKLPELGRSIGKAVKGFRNVTDDVRQSIEPDITAVQHDFSSIQENIATSATEIENGVSLNPTDSSPDPDVDLDSSVKTARTHSTSLRDD